MTVVWVLAGACGAVSVFFYAVAVTFAEPDLRPVVAVLPVPLLMTVFLCAVAAGWRIT